LKAIVVVVLFARLVLLAGIARTEPSAQAGLWGVHFAGKVVDEWNRPLAGAKVRIVGTVLLADTTKSGSFDIQGAPSADLTDGTVPIEVSAEGFATKTSVLDSLQKEGLTLALRSFTVPQGGDPVDVTPWAYVYLKGAPFNPPETQWLEPASATYWGCLWEARLPVRHIEVEFPPDAKTAPSLSEWIVSVREGYSPMQKQEHSILPPSMGAVITSAGTEVLKFDCSKDINGLKLLYSGAEMPARIVGTPVVHAFPGRVQWRKPLMIEIEWGFQSDKATRRWDGWIDAQMGYVGKVAPLESRSGVVALGEHYWKDGQSTSQRRGLRATIYMTTGSADTRTIVTLRTREGNFSFAPEDLDKGPIFIPSVGVFVTEKGTGMTAREFEKQLAAKHLATVREKARQAPEENWLSAMKRYHGDRAFPPIPAPPYDTPMMIDVPEKQLAAQWRLGYWHLKRWTQRLDDRTFLISIWPFSKSSGGNEGATAIGLETSQIIRTLDLLGDSQIAQGGLNYWIYGDHATPRGLFVKTVEGTVPLSNLYNGPNHQAPGYDQHASGGHGRVLEAAALHCRIADNDAWFKEIESVISGACDWILLQREAWSKDLSKNSWCYGLEPPADVCDGGDIRLYFASSAWYYAGLKNAAELLSAEHWAGSADLLHETERFRQDVRKAADRSLALTPVVRIEDGTYRRCLPFAPYMRGLGADVTTGLNGGWHDAVMGALLLIRSGIYDVHEPVVQELLDVYEGRIVAEGQNSQNGYNDAPAIHLLLDDVPLFLRGMYNAYAAEIEPDKDYLFWECDKNGNLPFAGGDFDKTFEEAAFLERVRMMLVMEDGDSLWLARATPRAWLQQGEKISVKNSSTWFGPVAFEIVSDVAHDKINAVAELPARKSPAAVLLRFRHPARSVIKSVTVNGQPWQDFDPAKEVIRLTGLTGHVTVSARY
jgi:hypothetical protein